MDKQCTLDFLNAVRSGHSKNRTLKRWYLMLSLLALIDISCWYHMCIYIYIPTGNSKTWTTGLPHGSLMGGRSWVHLGVLSGRAWVAQATVDLERCLGLCIALTGNRLSLAAISGGLGALDVRPVAWSGESSRCVAIRQGSSG